MRSAEGGLQVVRHEICRLRSADCPPDTMHAFGPVHGSPHLLVSHNQATKPIIPAAAVIPTATPTPMLMARAWLLLPSPPLLPPWALPPGGEAEGPLGGMGGGVMGATGTTGWSSVYRLAG